MRSSALLQCTASAIALLFASSAPAFAQQAPAGNAPATNDKASDNANVAEIVVTGSRVATGADAPTPVTVVTPEAINAVAMPNIADALVQLPALRSSTTASKGGQGTNIGATLNLRGLGAFRTLVLVDGQRFVPTPSFGGSPSQAVNIDSLPQGLIKRVDTVTGGASAAYGSDAVAGVVNFVLDHEFTGLKAEANYGETSRSDGIRYNGYIAAGGAFADGKGHVIMEGEYAKDEGIGNDPLGGNPARPWQSQAKTIGRENVGGGVYKIVNNATEWQVPLNGLVMGCTQNGVLAIGNSTVKDKNGNILSIPASNCSAFGTSFNNAGTATQIYNQGTVNGPTSTFANGGDGYQPGGQSVLDTPSTRYSLYTRAGYDISSKLNVYASFLSAETISNSQVGSGTPSLFNSSTDAPLAADYAYLPANLSALMTANNISSININKTFNVTGQQIFDAKTTRVTVGGNYQLNDNWSADFYYEYGQTSDSLQLNRFVNTIAFKKAVDAVVVTAANQGSSGLALGSIACRSTLSDPSNGCVPYNLFGQAPLSAAVAAYVNPSNNYFIHNSQQVAEATIKGSPFALPAGPVDIALGAGYRKESLNNSTDTLGLAALNNAYTGVSGASIYLNQPAVKGSLDVGELFGEAQVPLLKDLPFVKALDLNMAGRYTNYSSSGGVETWKIGLVWQPVDGVRFRAAQSRDVRAANVVELFSPKSTGFASVNDPENGGAQISITPTSTGNPNLTPEKANTTTIGVVYQPNFLPGAYGSVDFYNIDITGEIGTVSSQVTLNLCHADPTANAVFCNNVIRTPSGSISTIYTPYLNLAAGHNRGLDIELGYTHDINRFGLNGNIGIRLFTNLVFHNSTTTPGSATTIDNDAAAGHVVSLLTANYATGPWNFALQEHYVDGGRFSVTDPRYVGDTAPSQMWTDLSIKRKMGPTWEMYGAVINLFDKDPPNYPFTGPSSGSGTSTIFDTQGRRFEVGARFKL